MPAGSLEGRVALVTGAAQRIGREIALALAKQKADVVVHYHRSVQDAEELRKELAGYGVKAWLIGADFNERSEYEALISKAQAAAGHLDILVNSASIFPLKKLESLDFDDLVQNIQVNAWAPFVLCRDFARQTKEGQIVNLLDSRISGYDWKHVSYILSKHVLAVLTSMMALEFAPGITVNGVAPGLILPPPGKPEEYLDRMVNTVPLKRHGDPADIAQAVICLLQSDFVTGQVFNVDGGRHLWEYTDGPHPDH